VIKTQWYTLSHTHQIIIEEDIIVNKKRPINLDLASLKYPPMAIVSILHRMTGIVLFLLLPFVLFILSLSLHSEDHFTQMKIMLTNPYYKLMLWMFAAAFMYHLFAGIRHMIMDLGFGEELCASRRSAVLIIVLGVISTLLLGIWIW
jgi:succinate dehydrogenase / fumarate reductase, cytochrome b subunit